MNQQQLAYWLKIIIIGMALCGVIIYAWMVPYFGMSIVSYHPEFLSWFWPWMILILITAIPCYLVLYNGWQIAVSIANDQSFTQSNAKILKRISHLAMIDAMFFFAMNCLYLFIGMNHPGVLIASLFIVFTGVAFSVVTAAISHLVSKASDIREENEWTI
ncbi:DUF2975 domain-containing protein [Oceanirhabdus seepicola]|uniref:DUF2975 domain-containing protein n=1 Tax=Oceanirhabdus seepicola TaxID=2828781 RepID=A0A9J6NYW3_9CLOT|nr:DUF2975 domain-containing protein [Oceanirhabdus seepicola]MCM1989166.1 DUF2975 domain-containing protein [Oceanirhabdus seepicola]